MLDRVIIWLWSVIYKYHFNLKLSFKVRTIIIPKLWKITGMVARLKVKKMKALRKI